MTIKELETLVDLLAKLYEEEDTTSKRIQISDVRNHVLNKLDELDEREED